MLGVVSVVGEMVENIEGQMAFPGLSVPEELESA
jgi:hypothetical protein